MLDNSIDKYSSSKDIQNYGDFANKKLNESILPLEISNKYNTSDISYQTFPLFSIKYKKLGNTYAFSFDDNGKPKYIIGPTCIL